MIRNLRIFQFVMMFCFSITLSSSAAAADNGGKVCSADKGKAEFPIIIAENASDMTKCSGPAISCVRSGTLEEIIRKTTERRLFKSTPSITPW